MYEELVKYISRMTLTEYPDLNAEEELLAAITHWLHNREFNFHFRNNDLIDYWVTCIDVFCRDRDLIEEDIMAAVIFLPPANDFNFVDLFAGIGGFNLALQAQGGRCVFSSEWDKSAKQTYFKNYGKTPFGDITKFTNSDVTDEALDNQIPDHRILAGGFPCQPFSHAGVSARNALGLAHGFNCETQGTLFHSIARIAYVKQPEVVFMENVRNLVTHDSGETFKVIRETMEQLGDGVPEKQSYKFFYALVNSQTVVAQRRIRCFMVCIRKDIWDEGGRRNFIFPDFDGDPIPLGSVTRMTTAEEAAEYTISDKLWQGHINRTKRNLERNTGFTAHEADLTRPSNTIVARYGKDGKECLVPQEGQNPRKITRDECRQLFGYPDDFWMPDAKTPTYKQFGNSVVVPVVTSIAENIAQYLGDVELNQ
ncbi:MAG: DNA (cytosine-5-)-methyltransferase [Flavobacteriales bacterium]|nr:DNA (cytosine-5-)-methyltransferase [Flavobacteriales bacterium]